MRSSFVRLPCLVVFTLAFLFGLPRMMGGVSASTRTADAGGAENEHAFDGKTEAVAWTEAARTYDAAAGFTLSLEVKLDALPENGASLASHYRNSRSGGWRLGLDKRGRPQFVMIDATPYPGGYKSVLGKTPVVAGQWQRLVMTFDGATATLLSDGGIVGSLTLAKPLLMPSKAALEIGGIGLAGRLRNVRIENKITPVGMLLTGRNFIRNSRFGGALRQTDCLAWNRMDAGDYIIESEDWHVAPKARRAGADSQPLRNDGNGRALHIPAEIAVPLPGDDPWTFSVYLKADKTGVPVELKVGSHLDFSLEYRVMRVVAGTEWKRYELPLTRLQWNQGRRMGGRMQGPMHFWITPVEKGATVWVDAPQWEPGGKALPAAASLRDKPLPDVAIVLPKNTSHPPAQPLSASTFAASARRQFGEVPILVHHEGNTSVRQAGQTLGVPFPAGTWGGQGEVTLHDAGGREIPVQASVLVRWPRDGSVQSAEISFGCDLEPGENRFVLRYDSSVALPSPPPPPMLTAGRGELDIAFEQGNSHAVLASSGGFLWEKLSANDGTELLGCASIEAVGMDGTRYSSRWSRETVCNVEKEGGEHASVARRGFLADESGVPLLMYVARLNLWRMDPRLRLEVTLINVRPGDSVVLREAWWQALAPGVDGVRQHPMDAASGGTEADAFLQYYHYGDGEFRQALVKDGKLAGKPLGNSRGPLWITAKADSASWFLQVEEAWEKHPAMAGASEGALKGWLWPGGPVMGLELTSGISFTRSFALRAMRDGLPAETRCRELAELGERPAVARTAPEWYVRTDLLMPMHRAEPERFPYIENLFADMSTCYGAMSPQLIEKHQNYGLFDFGDYRGDGGWGNLESYIDYSILLWGLRNGDPDLIRQGLVSARHYRDVDVQQIRGNTIIHSPNHVMGNTDFSHAWPQGVAADYLLTGNRRSRDVVSLNGEYMLGVPLAMHSIQYGRIAARFLLNLAYAYQVTGDERYRERFMLQIAHAEKQLHARPAGAWQTIFPNLPVESAPIPYHIWYGAMALVKMHRLTGDARLAGFIDREVKASLNMDLYRRDLQQLWPGASPEDSKPIMISDFARHRGNYFYAVMSGYSKISGDPSWAGLGLDTLYTGGVLGGRFIRSQQAVMATAAFNSVPPGVAEKMLIKNAQDIVWQAAAPSLPNGDFSSPTNTWDHWRPGAPSKSLMTEDWEQNRRLIATLDQKTFGASAPSLRLNLSTNQWFTREVLMDSARFQIAPGEHRLRFLIKRDASLMPPEVRLYVCNLLGETAQFSLRIPARDNAPESGGGGGEGETSCASGEFESVACWRGGCHACE